jgi:hypothetical protein
MRIKCIINKYQNKNDQQKNIIKITITTSFIFYSNSKTISTSVTIKIKKKKKSRNTIEKFSSNNKKT